MSKFIKLTDAKSGLKFIERKKKIDRAKELSEGGATIRYCNGSAVGVTEDLDTIYSMLEPTKGEAIDPDKPLGIGIGHKKGMSLNGWKSHARRDDCFDGMVPSDLRQLLGLIK